MIGEVSLFLDLILVDDLYYHHNFYGENKKAVISNEVRGEIFCATLMPTHALSK